MKDSLESNYKKLIQVFKKVFPDIYTEFSKPIKIQSKKENKRLELMTAGLNNDEIKKRKFYFLIIKLVGTRQSLISYYY